MVIGMSREENVKIFEDTLDLCDTNKRLIAALELSKNKQYIVKDGESVDLGDESSKFNSPAKVVVSKKRCLEAAEAYKGKKVCVHNFASATRPGGGVTKGSSAQEEAICRCSTLYYAISDDSVYYKFHNAHYNDLKAGKLDVTYNDDCVYTPGVVVFKSDTEYPELLSEEKWYEVNVITCAAPNLRNNPKNVMNPSGDARTVRVSDEQLKHIHMKRIRRILDICKKEKADVVILGAFGCGAFSNNPKVVATAMNEVIKEYVYDFETIEFAVYCPPNNSVNYDAFKSIIK